MRKSYRYIIIFLLTAFAAVNILSTATVADDPGKPVPVPSSPQRSGDPIKGFEYLVNGDYVKGGIPYDFYLLGKGKEKNNFLKRSGLNGTVSHEYTVVRAPNGENLVAPNCMQCHSQVFNDSLIMGMGNSFMDFSSGQQVNSNSMKMLATLLKATAPAKYAAAENFIRVTGTIAPYLKTEVRGVNAADRLAAVLVAHRDPVTLKWSDTPRMAIPAEVIPSDVPAWWLLKKKNAMFYNGFGRGDFGRFLMASNLLTVTDTSEAAAVDRKINDVLAYIYTLKPPKYPKQIDHTLAGNGKDIFIDNCAKCHGNYGDDENYPNLLVPAALIKTDTALFSANYQNPQFVNWFNNSWFAQGDHPAKLVPYNGYIAPPLDGIWSTAPYLHNGSVPTLEALLHSKSRPRYWSRDFAKPMYNYEQLGWEYSAHETASGAAIYNTTLKGYGNQGHYFGDKLSEQQRQAVLEYLKTL